MKTSLRKIVHLLMGEKWFYKALSQALFPKENFYTRDCIFEQLWAEKNVMGRNAK